MLPPDPGAKRRSFPRRLLTWTLRLLLAFVAGSVALVLLFRFIDPPTSAMMIERRIEAAIARDASFTLRQQWVDAKGIAPALAIADGTSRQVRTRLTPIDGGYSIQS